MRIGWAVALLLITAACNGDDTMGDADEAAIDKSARELEDSVNADVNQQIAEIEAASNAAEGE